MHGWRSGIERDSVSCDESSRLAHSGAKGSGLAWHGDEKVDGLRVFDAGKACPYPFGEREPLVAQNVAARGNEQRAGQGLQLGCAGKPHADGGVAASVLTV